MFFWMVFPFLVLVSQVWLLWVYSLELGGLFKFDLVSVYLCLLSFFILVSLLFVVWRLSFLSIVMLLLSLFSSFFCYCCVSGLWFWVFYEMSMLPLLLLLMVESPYSERFIATWYLVGYVVFTSLPMLLSIFYLSGVYGGLSLDKWSYDLVVDGPVLLVLILLSILFMTKMPLPPFHMWLPMVHAEASSPVSMCLSGYMMKLGLLGVFRFSYVVLCESVFSDWYVFVGLCFASLFFLSGCRELDGKRWLAFLSLSHMVIAAVCLKFCVYDRSGLCYVYCLGHGVSAGVVFLLLWAIYEICGTRNWGMLKCVFSSSFVFRVLGVLSLCMVASMPPTITFFSEVFILKDVGLYSGGVLFLFFVYLFMSGLVPLFVVGGLITRHYSVSYGLEFICSFLGGVLFLVLWGYSMFLVL